MSIAEIYIGEQSRELGKEAAKSDKDSSQELVELSSGLNVLRKRRIEFNDKKMAKDSGVVIDQSFCFVTYCVREHCVLVESPIVWD